MDRASQICQKKLDSTVSGRTLEPGWQGEVAHRHQYGGVMIRTALTQLIKSEVSLRGVAQQFELWSAVVGGDVPSYSSIRQWLLRVGLYEWQRERERRNDWIFVVDMTIELGSQKCLVVLGIGQREWSEITRECDRSLSHQDMEVLLVKVMSSTVGEQIHQTIEHLSQRVGVPLQVVADHGSDLKKGIDLYVKQHPKVLYTYDVTHQMARLVRDQLADDEIYQRFVCRCAQARQQLQQHALSFLMPPTQRAKARYFNVDRLVDWAMKVLHYQHKQDFSVIDSRFCLDSNSGEELTQRLAPEVCHAVLPLKNQFYPQRADFETALKACLMPPEFEQCSPLLIQLADQGRRLFEHKLGWLSEYAVPLQTYAQMLSWVKALQHQLKHQGLTKDASIQFRAYLDSVPRSSRLTVFADQLLAYLHQQTQALPPQQPLLASSDTIESIFGKYKHLSAVSPLKHMGHLLLTLPLLSVNFSNDWIKTALEHCSFAKVEAWFQEVFGQSPLAKRRAVFRAFNVDT